MPHIYVSASGQHWFRYYLVTYSVSSHYLNQCRVIVNWTLRKNFSEILIKIQYLAFMKIHLKISYVKRRPFCPWGDELMRSAWPLGVEPLSWCTHWLILTNLVHKIPADWIHALIYITNVYAECKMQLTFKHTPLHVCFKKTIHPFLPNYICMGCHSVIRSSML